MKISRNVTTADLTLIAKRLRSMNERTNIPFYIFAPDYRDSSAGIRVLHYLCHILNEMGEEAYIVNAKQTSPHLRTPKLTYAQLEQHFLAGLNPASIYPEIIWKNPANTPLIVRWLLNIPGHLGEPLEFEAKDIICFYEAWCMPPGLEGQQLYIHPVNHAFFHNNDNPDDKHRTLECYYANKYFLGGNSILDEHKNLISLGQNIKRSHKEIAAILRKAKVLYCYEPSGMLNEAQACGCPVILVRSEYWPLGPDDTHHHIPGLAIHGEPDSLARAGESLTHIPETHMKARDNSWTMTRQMVEAVYQAEADLKTNGKPLLNNLQQLWALASDDRIVHVAKLRKHYEDSGIYLPDIDANAPKPGLDPEQQYAAYIAIRNEKIREIGAATIIANQVSLSATPEVSLPDTLITIIVRSTRNTLHLLANTLDSLAVNATPCWQLIVVSNLDEPAELDGIDRIHWINASSSEETKLLLDNAVAALGCTWVVELPSGTIFTERLFQQLLAIDREEIGAVFFDDDLYDDEGKHHSARFKPGVNPAALQSADLAGPICVRRDAWLSTGGTSELQGSPWFSKLLKLAAQSGWDSIEHVPDTLISYLDRFPSDTESCIVALVQDMQRKGIESEIVPASGQSWNIRYPLENSPSVSIAILSTGQLDLLSRCFNSVIEKTEYPNFEIIIALSNQHGAPDLDNWLGSLEKTFNPKIRIIRTELNGNYATRCNAAAKTSCSDFLLFLKEETVVIQGKWLEELVRTGAQPGIGGVSPRMIRPGSAMIENAGSVLGMNGIVGSPYQGKAKLGDELGYLDCIHVARDVSTLPPACMLIRKESYLKSGGMDEIDLGNHLAEIDLCLKLRKNGERLIYQPLSNIVSSDISESNFESDQIQIATRVVLEARAKATFAQRWFPEGAIDRYWNPNLSLAETIPSPEIELVPRWQFVPFADLPKIFAHPVPNGQGDFRVTSPLRALSKAGLVSECICLQRSEGKQRIISSAEILRLNPDSVIVQNYIHNSPLATLQEWSASGSRPFTVYALDDLITEMDASNPFRKDIPANARARLQYALGRCDRLVVSTEYLADAYRGFIPDIRVVPNRLEQAPWLPLRSLRRTGRRPRIGWAGGTTHQGDLLLLKEIIEQTRNEADWIFFGMCPDEIRPLLAEYHSLVKFSEYPAYLASLNLDLAVAPLATTPFNRGKSNLRLLDYGILGIPVVCTDIEPYRNSPACRVNNTVAEWTNAIRARIHDPDAREREGDALRRWVLDGYLLENHLEEWLEAHLPD